MGIPITIGNIIFEHPDVKDFDTILLGNEQATLHIYSVTFNSAILAIAPTSEWTRKEIYKVIRNHLPLIMALGKVEILLGSDCIGVTSTYDDHSRCNKN